MGISIARDNILFIIEAFLQPVTIVLALWGLYYHFYGELTPLCLTLSLILFLLNFPAHSNIHDPDLESISNVLISWFSIAGFILVFGWFTEYIGLFSVKAIVCWLLVTPVFQLFAILLLRLAAPIIIKLQGPAKRSVIVGINEQGLALAASIAKDQYSTTKLIGFFEDRELDRVPKLPSNTSHLGAISSVASYVKENRIDSIYLCLPVADQSRMVKLLNKLKDTTVSVYFVPDIFQTELIQGSIGEMNGIPLVALIETPFTGFNGMIKRVADILFSLVTLILISPVLACIAIAIKSTSPGPVIFKQRRYGLYGDEITVYKFRSMTVCEDGTEVKQATKTDSRITPLGAFLRKTSLDELPQFINVLQGRMSIVGPRPHAVVHNEMYRKMITGYMIRHKVKPGITGWAQVNGLRGETETLDKMKERIDYDIDYLRNWSPKLDMYIVVKTILVVLKKESGAY
ncbi:undecaprenyl-phosphate glucose phosphotransferase [Methyloradius palustris]|uniref:Undecaprenyl-phosphate glucose phosphotransferase n=1 Tax=Methyloradius palustris TaxID=2778876 RepID=A0A8D5FYT2_9PROT|nr:undecaprenyl-phosphate glucose phosphotransferase [Methyloradius palustris]